MKTTRITQLRSDKGELLLEYAHGRNEPFHVRSGNYTLEGVRELLDALQESLEVHRTDVPEVEIGANA